MIRQLPSVAKSKPSNQLMFSARSGFFEKLDTVFLGSASLSLASHNLATRVLGRPNGQISRLTSECTFTYSRKKIYYAGMAFLKTFQAFSACFVTSNPPSLMCQSIATGCISPKNIMATVPGRISERICPPPWPQRTISLILTKYPCMIR